MRSCFKAKTYSKWLWTVVIFIEIETFSVLVVALSVMNLRYKTIVLEINTSRNISKFSSLAPTALQEASVRELAHLPQHFVVHSINKKVLCIHACLSVYVINLLCIQSKYNIRLQYLLYTLLIHVV